MRHGYRKYLPDLWFAHRGYALVALGLALTHVVSFVDHALVGAAARHAYPVWSVANKVLPDWGWASLHLASFVLIMAGLYVKLSYARVAFVTSISTYLVLGASFLYASITQPGGSFIGVGFAFLAVLCSAAAALEPPRNPESERSR